MAHDEKAMAFVEPVSGYSSHLVSEAQSLKSKDEVEEAIQETFGPARDEEIGFHQHGGHHDGAEHSIETSKDPDLVDWDGPHDLANPMNWSRKKKWWISMLTAFMTFVISFGSSVFSATTTPTAAEFNVSSEVMILGVTLYVVGFACGPLVFGPLSEIYGRRNPLMIGYLGFVLFQIPVGVATNVQMIMVCRFLSGAFGSAPLAICAGMYVDFWEAKDRAIPTIGYAGAVFAGPTMGPIVGEFTVKNAALGWRWTIWFTMILGAVSFVLAIFTVPETLAPVLLQRKAAKLRVETRHWALHSKLDEEPVHLKALVRKYGLKPMQMIVQEPILIVLTIYISLVYGILYLIFFAFPFSFEFDRGWEFGVSALPFVSLFVGVWIACIYMGWETKVIFEPKLAKSGKLIPEERLPPMIVGSVVLVVGLFWFAWTSFPSINPWPQIIAGALIGGGIIMVFMPSVIYLVDVYLFDANSALAANAFVRSLIAASFPLFSTQ